jgi:hypothetical protein
MKLFLLQVGDHFCEQNDAVIMILQYATSLRTVGFHVEDLRREYWTKQS